MEANERSNISAQPKAIPALPNMNAHDWSRNLCAVIHLGGGSVVRILMDVGEVTKYATKTGERCCCV